MAYEEVVQDDLFKFEEEGDEFEGVYEGQEEFVHKQYGPGIALKFTDPEDETQGYTIFASSVLKTKFKKVPVGKKVKIVFKGTKPSKNGMDYKDYAVYIDR